MGVYPYGSVVLNHVADAFADRASAEAQLDPAIVKEYELVDQRVMAVQKRLLAANGLAMTQARALRPPKGRKRKPRLTVSDRLEDLRLLGASAPYPQWVAPLLPMPRRA